MYKYKYQEGESSNIPEKTWRIETLGWPAGPSRLEVTGISKAMYQHVYFEL